MTGGTQAPAVLDASRSLRRAQATRSGYRRKRSGLLTVLMLALLVYCVIPLAWLLINSTKNNAGLFDSFGLWFGHGFHLMRNIEQVFAYQNDIYARWLLNTVLYAAVGAGGAAFIAALGGYALAKYSFPGRRFVYAVVLGAIMIPGTALAVPTYLLFSKIGLVNTPWAVIVPSLASPFGFYLMRVYALDAVPDTLLEAARIDGASEIRIFRSVAWRLLRPGFVTVLLFQIVATWNNYFLPLIVLNDPKYFPLTVGLSQWNSQANAGGAGSQAIYPLVVTGSLLMIVPLVAAFLVLQRHWQSGLSTGSVKQ